MSVFDQARVWMREAEERRQERKLEEKRNADPAHVTVPEWLVRAAKFASWVATISLIYFLWLYTLDIARDRAGELHITRAGTWEVELSFWWPNIIGFAIVAFGIPYTAKIAIPTFMSLDWRANFWPKLWALVIAVAVSFVVIAGTFAVQGHTIMERDRESLVAVEQVQQGRAVLEAQIQSKRDELSEMMNNRNAYLAQAASVGAEEWQRSYINQTPENDPQRDRIVRALGAARAADTVRAEIDRLRTQLAQAPAVASVQGEIVTERTGWIADTLGWLEGVRAILLSLVMDIVALMMPWIALRLEQARNRQLNGVEGSGWADEAHRIPDLRDEPSINPQPMKPPREVVTDADTGEELVKVRPREYWRKRKGQKQKLAIEPEIPPDEKGVSADGGGRIGVAMSAAGPIAMAAAEPEVRNEESQRDQNGSREVAEPEPQTEAIHPEPSDDSVIELTDDVADALVGEEEQQPADKQPAEGEQEARVEQDDAEADQRREPETDPKKLIAAE